MCIAALEAAGSPQQCKRRGSDGVFDGRQPSQESPSDRQVEAGRLGSRMKESGNREVEVSAGVAMRNRSHTRSLI